MAKKSTTKTFQHRCDLRNTDKVIQLRIKHGATGYGVYIMLLEMLCEQHTCTLIRDYETIGYKLQVNSQTIQSVVEDFELFKLEEKTFYDEEISNTMTAKEERIKRQRIGGKKGAMLRWKNIGQPIPIPMGTPIGQPKVNLNNTYGLKETEKETEKESFPHTPYKEKEKEKEKERNSADDVDNTRESFFETKNETDELQNYINELKQDRSWQEMVCMKHHLTLSKLTQMFSDFIVDCKIQGKEKHTDLANVKYHLANWLRIQIEQENKKKNDTNKSIKDTKRRGYGVTATSAKDYTERL